MSGDAYVTEDDAHRYIVGPWYLVDLPPAFLKRGEEIIDREYGDRFVGKPLGRPTHPSTCGTFRVAKITHDTITIEPVDANGASTHSRGSVRKGGT